MRNFVRIAIARREVLAKHSYVAGACGREYVLGNWHCGGGASTESEFVCEFET